MSRTIPRAYVTAAWNDNPVVAKDDAVKYCTALVKEGYLPLCPILAFDGIFPADVEDAHKRKREMSEDMLRRSRFLVICGDARNEEVRRHRHRKKGEGHRHNAKWRDRLCVSGCR